jgi:hypothetical protein
VQVVAVESVFGTGQSGRTVSTITRTYSLGALGSQEIAPVTWRRVKRADIIHVHHPHVLADVAVLLRAGRAPVVVTHHGDAKHGLYRPAVRLVLRRAKAIVVPSRAHLALSADLRGYEAKTAVIPSESKSPAGTLCRHRRLAPHRGPSSSGDSPAGRASTSSSGRSNRPRRASRCHRQRPRCAPAQDDGAGACHCRPGALVR